MAIGEAGGAREGERLLKKAGQFRTQRAPASAGGSTLPVCTAKKFQRPILGPNIVAKHQPGLIAAEQIQAELKKSYTEAVDIRRRAHQPVGPLESVEQAFTAERLGPVTDLRGRFTGVFFTAQAPCL